MTRIYLPLKAGRLNYKPEVNLPRGLSTYVVLSEFVSPKTEIW